MYDPRSITPFGIIQISKFIASKKKVKASRSFTQATENSTGTLLLGYQQPKKFEKKSRQFIIDTLLINITFQINTSNKNFNIILKH